MAEYEKFQELQARSQKLQEVSSTVYNYVVKNTKNTPQKIFMSIQSPDKKAQAHKLKRLNECT